MRVRASRHWIIASSTTPDAGIRRVTVLVIRRLPHAQDRAYSYAVIVDGRQRAQIGDDSTVQIGLTPGEHHVRLRVKWCGTRELPFTIQPGEILRMECRPKSRPLLALLYITIWRNDYIALNTVTHWTP
jgi:hypothetical protein